MKKNLISKSRLMAVLVAIVMLASLFPFAAIAAGAPECGEGPYVAKGTEAERKANQMTPASKEVEYNGQKYNVKDFAKTQKWATHIANTENEFMLTLRVEGAQITPPPIKTVNVLVLDYSSSMTYDTAGKNNIGNSNPRATGTRLNSLESAVGAFINGLTDSDFVAVVTYNSVATVQTKGMSGFVQMNESGKSTAKASYASVGVAAATNVHAAMTAAYQLMNNLNTRTEKDALKTALDRADTQYNVIFMSDGAPTTYISSNWNTTSNAWTGNVSNSPAVARTWANATYSSGNASAATTESAALAARNAGDAAATAVKSLKINGTALKVFSVGFGASTGNDYTLIYRPDYLRGLSSGTGCYFDNAAGFTATEIFSFISGKILASVVGGQITDAIPAGFSLKDPHGIEAYIGNGTLVKDNDANIVIGKDASGNTTVTWTNLPNLGCGSVVELRIPVIADPTCDGANGLQSDCYKLDGDSHYIKNTNAYAKLTFTNVTRTSGAEYEAAFPVPAVHVPKLILPATVYFNKAIIGEPAQSEIPTFTVALYAADGSIVKSKDFNAAGNYSIGFTASELKDLLNGATVTSLTLKEVQNNTDSRWTYDTTSVLVTIDAKGAVTYDGTTTPPTFTNKFARNVVITLDKIFFDGEGLFVEGMEDGFIEKIPHVHNDNCYTNNCQHVCDGNCVTYIEDCRHVCGEDCGEVCQHVCDDGCLAEVPDCQHVCDEDCLALNCDAEWDDVTDETTFTFWFDLYKYVGRHDRELVNSKSITLTKAEIIGLINDGGKVSVEFDKDLNGNLIYANDSRRATRFVVIERDFDYEGWTKMDPVWFYTDRYNTVNPASMTGENIYGGYFIPKFQIGKELVDVREDYNGGDFEFELTDTVEGSSFIPMTIYVAKDSTETVTLSDYPNLTATLMLKEVNTSVDGMDYDATVYFIAIQNGKVVSIYSDGEDDSSYGIASFENMYKSPRTPVLNIEKSTNGYSETFMFDVYYYNYYGESATSEASRHEVITQYGSNFKVPVDFTKGDYANWNGVVVISEQDSKAARWTYDKRVYEFSFEDGILVGTVVKANPNSEGIANSENPVGLASFYNTYTTQGGGDYGALVVTKQFTGVSSIPDNWNATLTVTGPSGYSQTRTITSNERTFAFERLDPGTYTIAETNASGITGYTFVGVSGTGAYSVVRDQTTYATIVNAYDRPGTPPPPPVELDDPNVPLAALPPEDEDLLMYEEEEFTDEVPLSEMPQTGISGSTAPWLFGLGAASLFGLGAAGLLINDLKKKED